jgi:hypothetical protein
MSDQLKVQHITKNLECSRNDSGNETSSSRDGFRVKTEEDLDDGKTLVETHVQDKCCRRKVATAAECLISNSDWSRGIVNLCW